MNSRTRTRRRMTGKNDLHRKQYQSNALLSTTLKLYSSGFGWANDQRLSSTTNRSAQRSRSCSTSNPVVLALAMSTSFTAQSKDDALAQYTQLSSSPNPNDKLLALGGLVQFMQTADREFLLRCSQATDYNFLDRMIRGGNRLASASTNSEMKVHEEVQEEKGNFRQLAIAVLAVFSRIPEMRGRDELLQRIPALVSCLMEAYSVVI